MDRVLVATKGREETEVAMATYGGVTATFSEHKNFVMVKLSSTPHALEFRLPVEGARDLWIALGRLFFLDKGGTTI